MRLFVVFLFVSLQITAQKHDSVYVENVIKKTLTLKSKGKYKNAFQIINQLESKVKNSKNLFLKGRVVFTKGRIEIDLGEYDSALKSAKKAINYYAKCNNVSEKASAINLVGVAHYFKGDLDSTLVYYNKSFNLKKLNSDSEQLAITAYNIAIVYEDLGKFDEAIHLYKEAADYLLKTSKTSFLADIYLGISNTYKLKRDYDNSNVYGKKALNLAIETYGENNPNTSFFYTSYASTLRRKDSLELAKKFLYKAKNIREKSYGKNHFWTTETYLGLGEVLMLQKNYLEAEKNLKKTIELAKNNTNNLYGTTAKLSLAQLYFDTKKEKEKALTLTQQSLAQFKNVYGENHQDVTECYLLLAKLTKDENYIEKLLKSAKYNPSNLNGIIAPFQVLEAFKYQSDILKQKQKFALQFKLIDKQLALIKYIKKGFPTEKSKVSFANTLKEILEENILVCWKLFIQTNDEIYFEKAIELSEINRNSILLSAVKKKKLHHIFSEEELKKEQKLLEQKNKIDFAIHLEESQNNLSKENLKSLYEKRIHIYEKLDSFQEKLVITYPKYKELVDLSQNIDFQRIRSNINKNQTVISYFFGKNNAFAFVLNSNGVLFKKLEDISGLPKEILSLQETIVARKPVKETCKNLYKLIVYPIKEALKKELVFIPDAQLSYIPFEVLIDQNNKYLITDKTISYSGSLHLFYEQEKRQKKDFEYTWVGFSPSYKDDKKLATSNNETQSIANLMNGSFFSDNVATTENFKKYYNNTSALHLAMHTKLNQENSHFSELIFSDKTLKYSDIYASKMNANMIVLSACETGYGSIEKGEGVMSLSRAFSYAGIPSTVMSLWKVPDKETTFLMQEFYKKLKKGITKNKALQLTKKEYLSSTKDDALLHPFYWAGFVVNGNTSAIQDTNNYISYILLLLLLVLIFFRKRLLKFIK